VTVTLWGTQTASHLPAVSGDNAQYVSWDKCMPSCLWQASQSSLLKLKHWCIQRFYPN